MNIEQKAKAYDEALERAKRIHSFSSDIAEIKRMEQIFPELELEDERLKKELLTWLKDILTNPSIGFSSIKMKQWIAWLEKQGQKPRKVSIWKHWKDGICGNGEGKPIYLIKSGDTYRISSVLGYECDYIELSELDNLMIEKQKPIDKIQLGKKYKCIASPRYSTFRRGKIYKPVDNFLCNLMNLCYECFEPIEDSEQKPACGDDKKPTDVNHEYFSELLENNDSEDIDDYAYQCAYCMSHDWIKDTATWDDIIKACRLGAEWNERHHKSTWSEEDDLMLECVLDKIGDLGTGVMCKGWLKSLKNRIKGE